MLMNMVVSKPNDAKNNNFVHVVDVFDIADK